MKKKEDFEEFWIDISRGVNVMPSFSGDEILMRYLSLMKPKQTQTDIGLDARSLAKIGSSRSGILCCKLAQDSVFRIQDSQIRIQDSHRHRNICDLHTSQHRRIFNPFTR